MRFFAPQEPHVAPIGVKFGMGEEGTGGPLRRAKFHPMGATTSVYSPKTEIFTHLKKMWNINAPQQRMPYAIFTKFAEFVPHFRMR